MAEARRIELCALVLVLVLALVLVRTLKNKASPGSSQKRTAPGIALEQARPDLSASKCGMQIARSSLV